jgi:cytochrome c peroxidase
MLGALGALAAGTAYYFYGTAGTPKETAMELKSKAEGLGAAAEGKLGMRHSKADYQKVYDKIAEMMEKEDHDGEWFLRRTDGL